MTTIQTILPTGTIRQRFEEGQGAGGAAMSLDELLAAIAMVAGELHLDPALVWTAKELTRNEPKLAGDEEATRALTLATLTLLIALQRGSTELPLRDPDLADDLLKEIQGQLVESANTWGEEHPGQTSEDSPAPLLEGAAKTIGDIRVAGLHDHLDPERLSNLMASVAIDENLENIPYKPLLICRDEKGADQAMTSERLLRKEWSLAGRLSRLIAASRALGDGGELKAILQDLQAHRTAFKAGDDYVEISLNDEQERARDLVAQRSLALITGGPGTGKTTIIVSALRLLVRLGVEPSKIALAAPTGKAAYRMKESIDNQMATLNRQGTAPDEADRQLMAGLQPARTLHRLLGYSPRRGRFWKNAQNRLEAEVIICDEASMIDVDLMHGLVAAMKEGARLVLVGDANQLPAVGGGAIFEDLVDTLPDHGVRLLKSYRQDEKNPDGKAIIDLANAMRDYSEAQTAAFGKALGNPGGLAVLDEPGGVNLLDEGIKRDRFLGRWFEKLVAFDEDCTYAPRNLSTRHGKLTDEAVEMLDQLFEHYGRARILCATQVGERGARAINRFLHQRFKEARGLSNKIDTFLPLEPVIVLRNNYDLGVFNGDQGLVVSLYEEKTKKTKKRESDGVAETKTGQRGYPRGHKYVVFPKSDGTYRAIPIARIKGQIEHAFATSIHKSQGSEFANIAVVIPKEKMQLVSRQLLYTGVTRASKSVTIFATKELFEAGVARKEMRYTGLSPRLAQIRAGDSVVYADAPQAI